MKARTRFIQSIVAAAKAETQPLPWTRGRRRAEFISTRNAPQSLRQIKSA